MEEFEDTSEDKESEVVLGIGDGLMVVGDGSGGLHEGTENGCGLAITDVVRGFLFQTDTQLAYQILLFHFFSMLNPTYSNLLYSLYSYDLLRNLFVIFTLLL